MTRGSQKRQYADRPWVAVGAVIFHNGGLLLVRRGREPRKEQWTLPGGMVELGEELRSAVIREVREECGIEIEPTRLIDVIDFIERDESDDVRYHYVIVDYEARYLSGRLRPGTDVREVGWFQPTSLPDLPIPKLTRDFLQQHYTSLTSAAS